MKGDASPFDLEPAHGGPASHGVLCIHGFTSTPFEVRYLGERLASRGYRVVGPVLAGHGTSPNELDRTTWHHWYASVEAAFDRLKGQCERVAVVGESLGGLLTLYLARQRPGEISALGALATPLWLPPLSRAAVRATRAGSLGRRLIPRLPKLGGSDVCDPTMKEQNPAYPVIPVRALHQLVEFMGMTRTMLPAITIPTVVVHGRQDHTAPYACSLELAARLRSQPVEHHALERSYHLIAIDVERELVADLVGDFIDRAIRTPRSSGKETP